MLSQSELKQSPVNLTAPVNSIRDLVSIGHSLDGENVALLFDTTRGHINLSLKRALIPGLIGELLRELARADTRFAKKEGGANPTCLVVNGINGDLNPEGDLFLKLNSGNTQIACVIPRALVGKNGEPIGVAIAQLAQFAHQLPAQRAN